MHSSPGAVFPPHQKASACHSFQPRNFPFSSRPAGKQRVRRRARVRPCVRILIDSGFGYGFINTSSINFFIYIYFFCYLTLNTLFHIFHPLRFFSSALETPKKEPKVKNEKKAGKKTEAISLLAFWILRDTGQLEAGVDIFEGFLRPLLFTLSRSPRRKTGAKGRMIMRGRE